jgi:hypothetical protein
VIHPKLHPSVPLPPKALRLPSPIHRKVTGWGGGEHPGFCKGRVPPKVFLRRDAFKGRIVNRLGSPIPFGTGELALRREDIVRTI